MNVSKTQNLSIIIITVWEEKFVKVTENSGDNVYL